MGDGKMKIKMAVVASSLLVSAQTASAQMNYYPANPYYQSDTTAAEKDLADVKALRDKARKEREETGKSDVGARLRLQEECTRAIERGVEDGVRLSYGCGQSSYAPSVKQQPAGPKVVYPPK
jgi:hypothetical protein